MKVFILDNGDMRCVLVGTEVLKGIEYELEAMSPGDDFSIECREMTEEEVSALPEE